MTDPGSSVDRGPTYIHDEAQAAIRWLDSLKGRLDNLQEVDAQIKDIRSLFGQMGVQTGSPNSSERRSFDKQTDSFNHLRATWDLRMGDADRKSIVDKLIELLRPVVHKKTRKEPTEMTVMHLAAFLGLSALMEMLAKTHQFLKAINKMDSDGQTPLHLAALMGSLEAVKFLDSQEILRADLEDSLEQTAFEIADEVGWHEIVKVLLNRLDVKNYLDKRRADRAMYGDGTNAMLVGAALIASITFAGWLQPPLGYQKYYQYPRNATMPGAPVDDFQQYAAIAEHSSVKVFWVTNSLSFYFAIAALLTGPGALLPRHSLRELAEVKRRRGATYLTGFMFAWAVVFVVIAFTAAGFASLPPGLTYRSYMIFTFVVGCYFCMHSFIGVRMLDPSAFLKYLAYLDPALYFYKLSDLLERWFGYQTFESRIRLRKKTYSPGPDKGPSQGRRVPGLFPKCCRDAPSVRQPLVSSLSTFHYTSNIIKLSIAHDPDKWRKFLLEEAFPHSSILQFIMAQHDPDVFPHSEMWRID